MNKPESIFAQYSRRVDNDLTKQIINDKLEKTKLFTEEEKYLIQQALINFKG